MENQNKKVILETSADLYRLPLDVIKNTKLYNFDGKYYKKLYEEALKIERSGEGLEGVAKVQKKPINGIEFEIVYKTQVTTILII
jgi:hypothetical protein